VNSPSLLISNPDVVRLGLHAGSGEEAIRLLHGQLVADCDGIRDPDRLLLDLIERARLSSVCIADDIALPHARTSAVDRLVLAVARAEPGVPFDPAHPAVRLIFLIGTPRDAVAEYLQMVSAVSRVLRNPIARGALLTAPDEADFRALLSHVLPT
jgi:mannitol/fructose-specific phosphotransferase system IIA component (Ntr-type)